ncbi:MAG: type 2 isopentenyl-diphosphate Delta-isomerase [Methanomicrobiaceae archaeon]|nr:type 2 isopentenyl-diphosphate Delta-isomerase [Methanomicrobiaceae archaeon]
MTDRKHTSSRKKDHLLICCENAVEYGTSGFDDIRLVHNALPECNLDTIDTSARFLGRTLQSPLFIAAMTGGHPDTADVNRRLARAAERFGLCIGVGSQRAALENRDLEGSFTVVREHAPSAFVCANLGIIQLRDHGLEWADRAVEMIDAQALCVHLNPLQEAIQPEGDHDLGGCIDALAHLCSERRYPVIAKETGSGISGETARKLWSAGVAAIDIGGYGGTNWAAVERERSRTVEQRRLGEHFLEWGIPAAVSIAEVVRTGGPVIATGGVRSGTDMAKAIALGAGLCGMALPLLKSAMQSDEALFETIEDMHTQLRVAMFLTGSKTLAELGRVRTYITGTTGQILHMEE